MRKTVMFNGDDPPSLQKNDFFFQKQTFISQNKQNKKHNIHKHVQSIIVIQIILKFDLMNQM